MGSKYTGIITAIIPDKIMMTGECPKSKDYIEK